MKKEYKSLRPYLLLWSTQSLSTLGSAMTSYALVLWLYLKNGSALQTALLSVCSLRTICADEHLCRRPQ